MPKLVPDDLPILSNLPTSLPYFQAISSRCKATLPSTMPEILSRGHLSIVHINAQSLHRNFDAITTFICKEKINVDLLLLSETWLRPDLVSCYQIAGYEMLHSIPANNITGKGCAMYIKNTIFPHCKIIDELSICQIEFQCLSVLVTLPAAVPFIVSTLYRSPSYPVSLLMPFLENSLNKIAHLNKPCFWGGDFNVNLFNYCESNDTMSFLDCMNSYGFFPTITVPTRVCVTPPFTATLIGNIFTNVLEWCHMCWDR